MPFFNEKVQSKLLPTITLYRNQFSVVCNFMFLRRKNDQAKSSFEAYEIAPSFFILVSLIPVFLVDFKPQQRQ
jgi:hypothetical protein